LLFKKIIVLAAAFLTSALIGCAAKTTGYGPNFEPMDNKMIRIGLLSPEIFAYDVSSGGVPEYRVDWSSECNNAMTGPMTRELARWGIMGIPLLDSADDTTMYNLRRLLRLHCDIISKYLYGKHAFLPQIEKCSYAVGDIGPFCDRFGIDGVLFFYGFDEHFSDGRRRMLQRAASVKTTQSACMSLVLLPLTGTLYIRQYRVPPERTFLCAIVAARDGSVIWFNEKKAADDADLRESGKLPDYLQGFLTLRRKK
jgi:hypothetical protein